MKPVNALSIILIAVMLKACATMTPLQQAYLSQLANTPIYCQGGEDCEVKWGRAILWITQNAYWKIRVQTDNLITTEGPLDAVYAAYQVQKIPLGSNEYQIVMSLGCGNPFGCVPSLLELKASFVQFVTSYSSSASTPEEEVTVEPPDKKCEPGYILKYTPKRLREGEWKCVKECEPGYILIYSTITLRWECQKL